MTKREIIAELLTRTPGISHVDSNTVVNMMFETMTRALAAGERVELRGFGSFGVKLREARRARNPKTGATVELAARRTPFFRAGKELRVKLNDPSAGKSESSL
jgi:integration host factor beta subunit